MPSQIEKADWDFPLVHELLSSLSSEVLDPHYSTYNDDLLLVQRSKKTPDASEDPASSNDTKGTSISLGDFSQIWKSLGIEEAPVPTVAPFEASIATQPESYTSDGAMYYPPTSRSVRWRDEVVNGGVLTETKPDGLHINGELAKRPKKKNKKAKQEMTDAEVHEMVRNLTGKKAAKSMEPCGETVSMKRPQNKVSANTTPKNPEMKNSSGGSKNIESRASSAKEVISTPKQKKVVPQSEDGTNNQSDSTLRQSQIVTPQKKQIQSSFSSPNNKHKKATKSERSVQTPTRVGSNQQQTPIHKWPIANPAAEVQQLSGKSPLHHHINQVTYQSDEPLPRNLLAAKLFNSPTPDIVRRCIEPLDASLSSDDRNWSLLLKLMRHFPEDRKYILAPLQLTTNSMQATGIHVFIDASNILIGYHEHLKRARGIPEHARVPRVYPSFYALALLLERRRSVAKRILCGSNPDVAPFDEARKVGYETNIFEKVHKIREMTERQKRFAHRDLNAHANGHSSGNGSESATGGSGSGGNSLLPAAHPRWVEQGVDELLHLKMLESIVDGKAPGAGNAQVPRPTMVVATGDAAEAEYSSGFLKMIHRALEHGWEVEVAAWSANISMEYWNLERSRQWKGRFRVIKLDDFAEELFPVLEA